jgi:hypothetical protein
MAKQRRHVHHNEPIGTAWKEIIERILVEEGRERALAQARTSSGYDVVVRTPITFFVRYSRKATASPRMARSIARASSAQTCANATDPALISRNAATKARSSPRAEAFGQRGVGQGA